MHRTRSSASFVPSTIALAITRRPGMIALLLAVGGLLWSCFVTTEPAVAARYTVAQCGWKVGNDGGWYESASGRFSRSSWCGVPEGSDPWDGVHMASSTRPSTRSVSGERFARWRWSAPAGTRIVTVSGDRWHVLEDGFRHRLGFAPRGGKFEPFADHTDTDKARSDFSKAAPGETEAFESRLLCAKPDDRACVSDSTSLAGVRGLTITLDDSSHPTTRVINAPGPDLWVRGSREVRFSSTDSGSGVWSEETNIDGSRFARTAHDCEAALIAGQWRGKKMRPCPSTGSGIHRIDTALLGDGPHSLIHCSSDFASNRRCTEPLVLNTDNTAPGPPRRLTVLGGEGWRNTNSFGLTWETPDQGRAAPVTAFRHRITGELGPIGSDQETVGSDRLDALQLPGPGLFTVSVWLVDAAGNADPSAESSVSIGFDDRPPVGHLVDPAPDRPDRLLASITDSHSGVESAVLSVRPKGEGEWEELRTEFDHESGTASAQFGSAGRASGIWEVRLVATDQAGNRLVTDRRGNGSVMVIEVAPRIETFLSAKLAAAGKKGSALRIGPGTRPKIMGRLVTRSGQPLPEREVEVIQTSSLRRGIRRSTTLKTDRRGNFSGRLTSGASGSVSVRFPGTARLLASSSGPFDLRVRARVVFRARPSRLRNGQKVLLTGRILPGQAARLARGSLVEIAYLESSTRRWRSVLLTRVRAGGRFRTAYRFRYVTGLARIRLRAELLTTRGFPFANSASRPVTVRVSG